MNQSQKNFVGFGFGAIQGGLFLFEAFQSGNFKNLTVAEVMPEVVAALRSGSGSYAVNVAGADGITRHTVRGIAAYNPHTTEDRKILVEKIAEADEIATALPSVKFFDDGTPTAPAAIIADAMKLRRERGSNQRTIIYTAENHNHAAEILWERLTARLKSMQDWLSGHLQCLNTVIGKMSGVVTDLAQIREQNLAPLQPGASRCFLVETFNRILISRITLPDFRRGITVFEEKDDLLPFEEAKLYGHNATHALLGYLARRKGLRFMAEIQRIPELVALARAAFLEESGRALCQKYAGLDRLFTEDGYTAYADDLLARMLNPHLRDAIERVVRDPLRKLGWDDRLIGVMRLALAQGIQPVRYTLGAAAALQMLIEQDNEAKTRLEENWRQQGADAAEIKKIMSLIEEAQKCLAKIS